MTILSQRVALFSAILLAGAAACAADTSRQVWLVDTRDAAHCVCRNDAATAIRYWRMNDDCGWSSADAKDFHAGDELSTPTVVFVHGNRTDADDAVTKGSYVYQTICSEAADKPFRYVIWSWPAERIYRRHRDDAQLKAEWSDAESYCLALWLHEVRPGAKVSLVGHSFGPRIITGALHLLAGGELAGQKLPADTVAAWTSGKRTPVRAVLLAAAADLDWLAPGGRNGLALSLLDEVLVTRNGCDNTLKWYSWLYGRGGPEAMGFVGPCGIDETGKVAVVDVSATVGKTHNYRCYCTASNVSCHWAHYTFLDDATPHDARRKNAR
jgi:Alpha/beta hydrolase of unknown function (DUF900)